MRRKSWHVLSYDITDAKRYRACRRLLKDKALFAQRSVCLLNVSAPELQALYRDLVERLDQDEDDLRIYPLGSLGRLTVFGQNQWQPKQTGGGAIKTMLKKWRRRTQ